MVVSCWTLKARSWENCSPHGVNVAKTVIIAKNVGFRPQRPYRRCLFPVCVALSAETKWTLVCCRLTPQLGWYPLYSWVVRGNVRLSALPNDTTSSCLQLVSNPRPVCCEATALTLRTPPYCQTHLLLPNTFIIAKHIYYCQTRLLLPKTSIIAKLTISRLLS